jgi:hypothetical protein
MVNSSVPAISGAQVILLPRLPVGLDMAVLPSAEIDNLPLPGAPACGILATQRLLFHPAALSSIPGVHTTAVVVLLRLGGHVPHHCISRCPDKGTASGLSQWAS